MPTITKRAPARARAKQRPAAKPVSRPSRAAAEEAVRVRLRWAGDDPAREGLQDTPGRVVRAYDLKPDGAVTNHRVLYTFYPGRGGDGMRVDAAGHLYIAAGLHKTRGTSETLDTRPGIHVLTPQGKLVAFVETPEDTLTNCAFGGADGRTLYVTCGRFLLSLPTHPAGSPLYRVVK